MGPEGLLRDRHLPLTGNQVVVVWEDRRVALALPTNLVEAARRDPFPERREWLDRLPEIVDELAQRWSLRLGEPYQPGGQCSWVSPAQDSAGHEVVLKVAWSHDEAAHEADGLRAWAGRGAVLLHDSHISGPTTALLLERCQPGTALETALPEPEQDTIIAHLLQQLWSTSAEGFPFRPLQAMCDAWAAEFEERRLATSPGVIDPGLARAGIELFRSLPATAERQVLLCTDLHAGNVLAAQREPWLVIDPKPYLGDPAYDPLQHLLNCDRLDADPVGLARRMADLLDLDPNRMISWLFARCVQESLDYPALRDVAAVLAP